MNRFNKMNDDELNSFVKQNQPQAPDAEAGELNTLVRKLKLKETESSPSNLWMWLSTGVAASLLMFHFLTINEPTNTPIAQIVQPVVQIVEKTTETKVTSPISSPVLTEDEEEFSETNVPTLDIGEEYLTLAGI